MRAVHTATKPPKILLVEDDAVLARGVQDALEKEGFRVERRATGDEGLEAAVALAPDLVLLDVGLPGIDGLEVLRRLKALRPRLPVVITSARDDEFDRVLGLELGGDDYVTKPFSLRELTARIRARLRGSDDRSTPVVDEQFAFGSMRADLRRRIVHRPQRDERLTSTECALLGYLIGHRGADVSREELLEKVWQEDGSVTPRKVDNIVKKLRSKVEDDPSRPQYILTVHGKGYRFEP